VVARQVFYTGASSLLSVNVLRKAESVSSLLATVPLAPGIGSHT
jgi:hypothetical protein